MNWPIYSKKISNDVKNTLLSGKVNYWTGDKCKKFESLFSKYIGIKYCSPVANASVGLEIALNALNIGDGDEVIVPSRSYITTATSVLRVRAKPIFADVEYPSGNMSLKEIKLKITKKTKGVILVHMAGYPCEMDKIIQFCKKKKIKILEDCAPALAT